MSSRLRVGLVGAGGVGARHAAVLAERDDAELAWVSDVDAGRARALADEHGAAVRPDLDALLEDGPDAVWLCVPPFAHGAAERRLVEAGVPFLVEKPLSADLATAEELAALVERSGLVTATGYHWRGMPGVERAAQALADEPVLLASGAWWGSVPPVGWWARQEMSGGQVVEQATHLLDVLRVLAGEVVRVSAREAPPAEEGRVAPAVVASLDLASGGVASLTATSLLPARRAASVQLVGARGALVEVDEEAVVLGGSLAPERVPDAGASKRRVVGDLLDAVRTGDASRVRAPYAQALATHRVACAVVESVRTGLPVVLGDGA